MFHQKGGMGAHSKKSISGPCFVLPLAAAGIRRSSSPYPDAFLPAFSEAHLRQCLSPAAGPESNRLWVSLRQGLGTDTAPSLDHGTKEYETYVHAANLIAILQAKARLYLKGHAVS
jgi:hypothetical protein